MIQHKVFIGISLPPQVKKRLLHKMEKWQKLPIKWIREDNFHVTISFIGYISDEAIAEVCSQVSEAIKNVGVFDIQFEKITLAPTLENPNMVWLEGEISDDLKLLEESISKALGTFVKERKVFRPHVTLGKIRAEKWEALTEKPIIDEKFSISIPVDTIEVFESATKGGRKKYLTLESFSLS